MSFRLNKWSVSRHIYRLARCCNIYVLFDVALKVAHKSLIITVINNAIYSRFVVFTSLFTSYGSSNRVIDVSFTNGGSWIDSRCGFLPGWYPIFYHWFLCYYISMPFIYPTTKKHCWSPWGKVRWDAKAWEETVSNALVLTWFLDYKRIVGIRASPSTPMHFRLKTHTFRCVQAFRPHSNALRVFIENASIWKHSWNWIKTKTHTYRISADGRKRIKMKTMTSYVPRGL